MITKTILGAALAVGALVAGGVQPCAALPAPTAVGHTAASPTTLVHWRSGWGGHGGCWNCGWHRRGWGGRPWIGYAYPYPYYYRPYYRPYYDGYYAPYYRPHYAAPYYPPRSYLK